MRQLSHFPEQEPAETLAAALYVEGIANRLDEWKDGGFVVWVFDEQRMEEAKALLRLFEEDPSDERFRGARSRAASLRKAARREEGRRPKPVDASRRWRDGTHVDPGFVTILLIGASSALFLFTFPGVDESIGTSRETILSLIWFDTGRGSGWFHDIRAGELWRLVTPIFAHEAPDFSRGVGGGLLGMAHFLFNMYFLRDFGFRIEARQGAWFMLALVATAAVLSNTLQYLVSGGAFLGMSGVVFGCFGYLWIRGWVDPGGVIELSSSTITLLLVWFAIGFVGSSALWGSAGLHIANGAHAGGLVVGAGVGFVLGKRSRRRR